MEGFEIFRLFGEALAIGLLIGSERYKGKVEDEHQSAGLRTFAIIALLGAVCTILDSPPFTLITFGSLAAFIGLGYYRGPSESYGLTSELAALLTFWLAYLLRDYEALAISTGIILVILLAAKESLHRFVREKVTEREFLDTLKFLAVVFVVLPLLPNRYIGPLEFFNPSQVWILIILISSISYAGYILVRIFGNKKGLMISSVLGGLVSTTAVTLSLAERSRESPLLSRVCGVAGVMANSVQFPRLLFLIFLLNLGLGKRLLFPFLVMSLIGFGGAWTLAKLRNVGSRVEPVRPLLKNPFSLGPVLKFGVFFVGIFFLAKMAGFWLGEQGVYIASVLAGLGSVSAIALSVADMVNAGSVSVEAATRAVFLALYSNALLKWVLATINGTRGLSFWLGGGFLSMLGLGSLIALLDLL